MFDWQIPLKSIYREIIDFRMQANSNNYVQAGWQLVSSYFEFSESVRTKNGIRFYRVGWFRGAGEPVHPPIIDEGQPPRIQDFGHSTN